MTTQRRNARSTNRCLAIESLEDRCMMSAVPALHSLPTGTNTLYLDFDFHYEWRGDRQAYIGVMPFDMDGRSWELSQGEKEAITEIWRIVAEDFAPFDVNVTTVLPTSLPRGGKFLRAAIGAEVAWINGQTVWSDNRGNAGDWARRKDGTGNTMGGYSPLNGYGYSAGGGWASWIFPAEVGFDVTKIGNTISHEAGHGFGLAHQIGNGTEYNPGGSDWTPIMGDNTQTDRHFWYVGQGANGPQNDLDYLYAVLGQRPDDHGTGAQATPLTRNGNALSGSGVIANVGDQDWFSFETSGGRVNLTLVTGSSEVNYAADPARHGTKLNVANGNLDAILTLSSEPGKNYARIDPPGTLGAAISVNVPAGRYYVRVESNRAFDGNLGLYSIVGNAPQLSKPTPPDSFQARALSATEAQLTWSDSTGETSYTIYRRDRSSNTLSQVSLPANTTSFVFRGLQPGSFHDFWIVAQNAAGYSAGAYHRLHLPPTAPSDFRVIRASNTEVELTWGDATGETEYQVYRWDFAQNKAVPVVTLAPNTTRYRVGGLGRGTQYFIVAAASRLNGDLTGTFTEWRSVEL